MRFATDVTDYTDLNDFKTAFDQIINGIQDWII
jgi:hypothetical protein